jgi:hypothetical protein
MNRQDFPNGSRFTFYSLRARVAPVTGRAFFSLSSMRILMLAAGGCALLTRLRS